ncbi:MAG: hypothetical protein H5T76_30610 [Streptomyces sp.]|nr:hypothetical protein [Streptomyces sp.]
MQSAIAKDQEDLAAAIEQVERETKERAEQLRREGVEQKAAAAASLEEAGNKWQEHVAKVKSQLQERKGELDVKRAELKADDAEGYASFAIDFAGSAILEAEYAALEAVRARMEAEALAGR